MLPAELPASSRYAVCEPVSPRFWMVKAIGALIAGALLQGDPGYRGGSRYRVRDRKSGAYVYQVTTSRGGLDAGEAERSLAEDLEHLSVSEFEKQYGIRHTRGHRTGDC